MKVDILSQGTLLNYKCPCYGVEVTPGILALLKRMGAKVVPHVEKKKRIINTPTKTVPAHSKSESVKPNKLDGTKVAEKKIKSTKVNNQKQSKPRAKRGISSKEPKDSTKKYSREELLLFTRKELKTILHDRGHTNSWTDPLSPRNDEKKEPLIEKIILTNPVEETK